MTWVLTGGAALVGDELELVDPAVVTVAGSTLAEVGPAAEVTVPPDARTIAVDGLILIPGFIDAHVHLGFATPIDVVRGGVTTVRDLGWPLDRIVPMARDAAEMHGPTVLYAGPLLTAPGGYPTQAAWAPPGTGMVVHDPGDAAARVDQIVEAGASVVKLALNEDTGPTPDLDTVAAVVDAAHASGLRVTAHVNGTRQLEKALDAGVDELAHMLMGRQRIPPPLLRRMATADMTVVPTLSCRDGAERTLAIEHLEAFLSLGGRVVYGTDLGNGPAPGIDPGEVHAMSASGMSPNDILRSGTVDAARWLGLASKGSLRRGAAADLVALGGDPRHDASALLDVRRVWRAGREVPRAS